MLVEVAPITYFQFDIFGIYRLPGYLKSVMFFLLTDFWVNKSLSMMWGLSLEKV
jgi:hypothetical protein